MFSILKKRTIPRLIRQYSSNSPKSTNYLYYTALSVGFISVGYYIGINSKNSTPIATPSRSTSPLSTLTTPQYANDSKFNIAFEQIKQIVGDSNITFEEEVLLSHNDSFFSTHHPPNPQVQKPKVVVYPNSTEDVSKILKICNEYKVPLIANSGLTSLEGQNIHTRGPNSISLSFSRMDKILQFNPKDLDVVVQPGVGWVELDDFLKDQQDSNLMFGPDPGIGANIGGMVGTSASGTNASKYLTMKENVINLTVVLPDGTIIKTRQRPRKSAAGYDLTRLFIGTEGTLGVITEITLKLHVRPKFEFVSIASFPTITDAANTAETILSQGVNPNAMEILNEEMMSFVNETNIDGKSEYLQKPTLFFKIGGPSISNVQDQFKIIESISSENKCLEFKTSQNQDENEELWSARRNGLWSTYQYGTKILKDPEDVQVWTTDVAVPISKLSITIAEINQMLIDEGFEGKFSVMGHIGDGNCHFIILYNSPDYLKVSKAVDKMVFTALKYEGTCTGEHGVGIGKRKYLPIELGETSIDLMRHIKKAIDPNTILNPDKIFKIDPNDDLDEQLEHGNLLEKQNCMYNH
ncbi:unnamed protein product [Candida verbasci]|uniref:D-lactate dehydrogenase (cytochrome) n=1 Tax=Candida verbasci TaxID=1227364 RepID=A0A9W4TSP5_9ASCO|nr:unnamed protein product [Candida verbasci]